MKSHIPHILKGHSTVEEGGFLALFTSKKHVNFFNIKLNNLKSLMIRKFFVKGECNFARGNNDWAIYRGCFNNRHSIKLCWLIL